MLAIRPTLSAGQQGADIANLHLVLDKLGFWALLVQQERFEQRFGDGTAEAVRRVQAQFNIQTHQPGVVDDTTANSMNQKLFESGAFRLVRGRVTKPDGSSAAGNLVFAFDNENVGGAYLGSTNTNSDGAYQLYYDSSQYARPGEGVLKIKETIDLIVQVRDEAGKILTASPPLHGPAREVQIDLRVGNLSGEEVVPGSSRAPSMQPIQPLIRPYESGSPVANLQGGLLLLLENGRMQLPVNPLVAESPLPGGVRRELEAQTYGPDTTSIVRLFRAQYQEQFSLTTGEEVDGPTAEALNTLLKELGAFNAPSQKWVVRGRVTDAQNKGQSDYTIVLSELDLTGTTEIRRSSSKKDGVFEIEYDFNDALRQSDGTTAPDLVFQVFDHDGPERKVMSIFTGEADHEIAVPRLAESPQSPIVLMNVPFTLVLRIVVDLNQRSLTEFEQLVARLTPFMQQVSFADLKEDESNFQISFLSKESEIPKTKIEHLRDAFQQERQSHGVPAWAFFGLVVKHVALADIGSMKLVELVALLTSIQPTTDEQNLETVADRLVQYVKDLSVRTTVAGLMHSSGDLLQPILGSGGKLQTFFEAYARHEGDEESFWREMSQNNTFKEAVPTIQLTLQLSQLTLNNRALVTALQQRGIEHTRQLVDIPSEDWESLALANQAGMPKHIKGENESARAKLYAQELQTLVELAFPTEVIKKTVHVPEVKTFLRHNPDFDFTRTPVETYLQTQGEQAFQDIESRDTVKTELRKIQRMYTVTGNTSDMNTLLTMHYDSAHQVAMLSLEDFTQSLSGKISAENAYRYHTKAVEVSNSTAMVFHMLRDLGQSASFSTTMNAKSEGIGYRLTKEVHGYGEGAKNQKKEIEAERGYRAQEKEVVAKPKEETNPFLSIPNWEALFSPLDMCACRHCQSVYSPAAYFVDLLHILLGQKNGAARKELFRRRPDLLYTKLSCEHTETLMPYIDLVNEVLETYVANSPVGDADAHAHAKESTNDTSNFTTSELTANPQHTNDNAAKDAQDAYTLLQNATFPLNLPFDIHLATAREFFQGQQTTRFHLMRTFGDAMSHATAAERLEISEREFELLTLKKLDGTSDAGIDLTQHLWGNPPLAAGEVLGSGLANVQTFLSTTTIDYANLISLLKTRFLNPHFPINVYLQGLSTTERNSWLTDHPTENELALSVIELAGDAEDPCNLSKTRILHLSGQVLSDAELSRFNRFIRLWKKLGCTIAELDGLLTALGAPDIAPEVIDALAGVWHIRETLNLSLEQTAVLVGNIPTAGTGTLFAKLFLNKAILQIDEKFILNVSQTEVDAQTEFLKNHIPAILAALQITEEDLNRIGEYTKLDLSVGTPTSAKLTLANLSMIYRYVMVAKGRRIPLKDVITWFDILKLPPLVKVTDVMTSLDRLEKLQGYGFNAPDFAYVFQNEKPTGTTLPPKDDIINQSAKALQEGLLTLQQENTPTNDIVTAEFLKLKLAIFLEPEEATKIIGILDESNTQDTFSYLRTPQVSAKFKDVFQDYVTAADVTDMAATKGVPERFKKYWSKIEGKLLPVLRKTFIHQHLIATFNADAALIALMLQDQDVLKPCLDMQIGSDIHARAYKDLYRMLHKSMWLIGKLQLSTRELAYFQKNTSFADFNWKDFKIAAWLRVADFVALRHALPPADKDLVGIFQTAKEGGDVAQAIIAVTDWDSVNVKYFVGKRSGSEFVNELPLILLQTQNELSQRIGVSIEHLESWSTDIITKDQARDVKHTLKAKYDEDGWVEVSTRIHNTLRTRSRDALVSYLLQKSEMKSLGLRDTNDLYGYFLIDIEMDACMLTSRVKQAIASVQLFVQRVLLNKESFKPVASQRIDPGQIDAKQWKWMKNYRVWEANRKVFLYPENWIEPELRDNKSPFFKELESALLQGEVTDESAEKVLMEYLEKLHNVARLDVCGIYEDTEARELHVVGRTFNTPPQYFYRKLDLKTQVWTPWESVQVDIQGNDQGESAGVHLIPVVWNRRLYLFWPIFTEKSDREQIEHEREPYKKWNERKAAREYEINNITRKNNQNSKERDRIQKEINTKRGELGNLENAAIDLAGLPDGKDLPEIEEADRKINDKKNEISKLEQEKSFFPESSVPEKFSEPEPSHDTHPWAYWEVRLAWSEYRQNRWSNKKASQSFIRAPSSTPGVGPTYAYRFAVNLGETLKIQMLLQPVGLNKLLAVGEFLLNCNGKVTIKQPKQPPVQIINPKHMNFYESYVSADSFNFDNYFPEIKWRDTASIPLTLKGTNGEILSGSEKEYQVVFPPDHDFSDNIPSKFMYQDHKRAYYIEAEGSRYDKIILNLREPEKTLLTQTIYPLRPEPPQAAEKPSRFRFSPDQYYKISEEALNTVAEKNEIGVSAAMQIRSTKKFEVSSPSWMESEGAKSSSEKVRFDYFELATQSKMKLQFKPFFHAYVCQFMGALDKDGVDGLLSLDHQQYSDILIKPPLGNFFGVYTPNKDYVADPYPTENVDFSQGGAWSIYNWELFFHVPMLLANRLSQNQRFAEARRWYHFIFNPTTNENLASTARYWKVIPFRNTSKETLEFLLRQLHNKAGDPKRKELEEAIAAWRANPFNPHLIARMRLIAYQKNVVIKYVDNLITWGDSLFRQDTIESINEATQLYILAAEILGKRPEKIPPRGETRSLNYAELELESEGRGLDAFSNAMVKLETTFPFFNIQEVQPGEGGAAPILNRTTDALYFCLPDNDKLLGYWDTVAERLFKIRHCQNIEGIERQLALFEPVIDPALLVRAVAGGVVISSALADLNSPLPHYRFSYIMTKAIEICAELKSLGNSLLSVLEKKDAESLSMMRTEHDTQLLKLVKTVKNFQITESQRVREGLEKTRAVTEHRANFYGQLLKGGLSSSEKEHQLLSFASMGLSVAGQNLEMAASAAQPIPDTEVGAVAGLGGGPTNNNRISGGDKTAKALSAFGRFFNMLSTMTTFAANSAQTNANYQRRADEWKLQFDLATKELLQIDRQISAAEIREQIADKELSNHEQQLANAQQVTDFFRNKYTNEELYGWMVGEIATVYFQSYQLAYDLAKKAERTYRHELGLPTSSFIQFGIWDSFRKGLMSGERLYLSLKQMEKSYLDQNSREYEISKHVSLLHHDPVALITLKETGTCLIDLPETLFDADYPGHYLRRIKSVGVSIPCVIGPYTGINCTLTLLSSKTRISNKKVDAKTYSEDPDTENARVVKNFAAMQSIATSSGQNDNGMFELNFRDERYLPFEYSGVISRWRMELPTDFRQFDYQTISDVILHIKYTAREGGEELRKAARESLVNLLQDGASHPQSRLFSLRHEFPAAWHRLQSEALENGDHSQTFSLAKDRFPFIFQGGKITTTSLELFGIPKDRSGSASPKLNLTLSAPGGTDLELLAGSALGLATHKIAKVDVEVKHTVQNKKDADWTILVRKTDVSGSLDLLEDILVLCHYSVLLKKNP